ncbi:MAG: flagellar biosynthetic protein FliO [Gammaproteobacteria bacterium]|nr:flagellar biosynthetic protein FliO [Gammaproteobacteria bacterium]
MRVLRQSVVIMSALLLVAPVTAETIPSLSASTTGTGVVVEMIVVLAAVILLILGLGWLIKRVGNFPAAGKGMVRILGGVSLGPREKAVVVEAGNRRLLIGVAPGRVQTLCILDDSDLELDPDREASTSNFSAQLDAQLQDESR